MARLALGNPDFQRYLRLEEVLVRLVPAMASNAEALTHKGEEHDLMVLSLPTAASLVSIFAYSDPAWCVIGFGMSTWCQRGTGLHM